VIPTTSENDALNWDNSIMNEGGAGSLFSRPADDWYFETAGGELVEVRPGSMAPEREREIALRDEIRLPVRMSRAVSGPIVGVEWRTADAVMRFDVTNAYRPPEPVNVVMPRYVGSLLARAEKGERATVKVFLNIDEGGRVRSALVVAPDPAHDPGEYGKEVVNSMLQWKFSPATEEGTAAPSHIVQTFYFNGDVEGQAVYALPAGQLQEAVKKFLDAPGSGVRVVPVGTGWDIHEDSMLTRVRISDAAAPGSSTMSVTAESRVALSRTGCTCALGFPDPRGAGKWLERFRKKSGLQPGRTEMVLHQEEPAWKDTSARPAPGEPLMVGDTILPPQLLAKVRPEYPLGARAAGVEGKVILEAIINTEGCVEEMKILRSIPQLDEAAARAVCQWKYKPALKDGKPVRVYFTVIVDFSIWR
jgi:TonB family protein